MSEKTNALLKKIKKRIYKHVFIGYVWDDFHTVLRREGYKFEEGQPVVFIDNLTPLAQRVINDIIDAFITIFGDKYEYFKMQISYEDMAIITADYEKIKDKGSKTVLYNGETMAKYMSMELPSKKNA